MKVYTLGRPLGRVPAGDYDGPWDLEEAYFQLYPAERASLPHDAFARFLNLQYNIDNYKIEMREVEPE